MTDKVLAVDEFAAHLKQIAEGLKGLNRHPESNAWRVPVLEVETRTTRIAMLVLRYGEHFYWISAGFSTIPPTVVDERALLFHHYTNPHR